MRERIFNKIKKIMKTDQAVMQQHAASGKFGEPALIEDWLDMSIMELREEIGNYIFMPKDHDPSKEYERGDVIMIDGKAYLFLGNDETKKNYEELDLEATRPYYLNKRLQELLNATR
jgi:hypothetical protein